ncbi:MAG: Stp1/IreP family PP2C-type Ser/Thr phosphatase [Clostridia bacterium]|nr:Stp1/IreP family PP2C-type Ser/Thr phosphatase [Clostridia bacterium]
MQYYGSTNQGIRRSNNQDAFRIKIAGNLLLATVCDGMGGANGGNVASAMGIDAFTKKLSKYILSALSFLYLGEIPEFGVPCEHFPDLRLKDFIQKSVFFANREVFAAAEQDKSLSGMGTTLTSCAVTPKGIYTTNIGDSRIYYVKDGSIEKLTKDHSLVQSLIDEGKISEKEAQVHPNRNIILRALGVDEKVEADIEFFPYTSGTLLLCSDGLSNYFDKDFFLKTLESERSCEEQVHLLIDYANECGGADNITAVVIKLN